MYYGNNKGSFNQLPRSIYFRQEYSLFIYFIKKDCMWLDHGGIKVGCNCTLGRAFSIKRDLDQH